MIYRSKKSLLFTLWSMDIPVDMYSSSAEIVLYMPVWGTRKESVTLRLDEQVLVVTGERRLPLIKESLVPIQEQCFWWVFEKRIQLPSHVYFDQIHSVVTPENVLVITIPKILKPDVIPVKIL